MLLFLASSLFDWDSYLSMDSQSTAAHWMYFKQVYFFHVFCVDGFDV